MISHNFQQLFITFLCCLFFTAAQCADKANDLVPVDIIGGKTIPYGKLPACVQKDCEKHATLNYYEIKNRSMFGGNDARAALYYVVNEQHNINHNSISTLKAFVVSLLIKSSDTKCWYEKYLKYLNHLFRSNMSADDSLIAPLQAELEKATNFDNAIEMMENVVWKHHKIDEPQ